MNAVASPSAIRTIRRFHGISILVTVSYHKFMIGVFHQLPIQPYGMLNSAEKGGYDIAPPVLPRASRGPGRKAYRFYIYVLK